jgi:hypothetical protein
MQILLTVIALGAGTDYGLFWLRVREESLWRPARVTVALARRQTITPSAACVSRPLEPDPRRLRFTAASAPGWRSALRSCSWRGSLMPALAIFGRRILAAPPSGVDRQGPRGGVSTPQAHAAPGCAGGLRWMLRLGRFGNEALAGSDAGPGSSTPTSRRRAQPDEHRLRAGVRVASGVAQAQELLNDQPVHVVLGGLAPQAGRCSS